MFRCGISIRYTRSCCRCCIHRKEAERISCSGKLITTHRARADGTRDWDLWGPLVICLSLAIVLSIDVSSHCLQLREIDRVDEVVTARAVNAGVLARDLARHSRIGCRHNQLKVAGRQSVSFAFVRRARQKAESDRSFFQSLVRSLLFVFRPIARS